MLLTEQVITKMLSISKGHIIVRKNDYINVLTSVQVFIELNTGHWICDDDDDALSC